MNAKKAKRLRLENPVTNGAYLRKAEAVFFPQWPGYTHDPFRGLFGNLPALPPYFMGVVEKGRENIGKKAYNEAKKAGKNQ